MTYEEAKELFGSKNYQEIICHSNLCDYPNTRCGDCRLTDMQCRINESLEKQIPKFPTYEADGYANGELVYDTWYCPNCGKDYEVGYDDYDYCPCCGQRIDRREVEEC